MDFHIDNTTNDSGLETYTFGDLECSSKTSSSSSSSSPNTINTEENNELTKEAQQPKPTYLTLLFGADAEERIEANPFRSNRLNKSQAEVATTLSYYDFPPKEEANLRAAVSVNTTHLTVAIADYDDCLLLEVVRKLISQVLADSLTSVQLYIRFSNSPDFKPCAVHCLSIFYLLESLNAVAGLQHLTLVVEHSIFSTISVANVCNLDLLYLGRLKELYVSTQDDLVQTPLLHWLAKAYQQNFFLFSLQVLALGNSDPSYTLVDFSNRFPVLGRAITELPGIGWFISPIFAFTSFSLMPHLVHIDLKAVSTVYFFELLTAAAHLVNLKSMSIILDTASPETGHCPLYQFTIDPAVLPRFTALKSLKLVANVYSHADLQSPFWANAFPALESLDLEHNCITCKICPTRNHGTLCQRAQKKISKIVEECLFRTFKQCPKLNFISAQKNYKWAQTYVITEVNGQKTPIKIIN